MRRKVLWDFKGNDMKNIFLCVSCGHWFPIFLVTTLTYTIIYTMVPRKLIFKQDTNYNKIATTADKRDNYENTVYERMGYIEYYDTKRVARKS